VAWSIRMGKVSALCMRVCEKIEQSQSSAHMLVGL